MLFPIPQHLKKRENDYISYTVTDASGTAKNMDNICYASHMSMLSTHHFVCVPRRDRNDWRDFFIDNETFLRFMELLKMHKVIPATSEAWIDGDLPKLKFPIGTSRHRAYSALCAYRWSESLAPMVWQFVKLCDDMPQVSVWQVLHYVLSLHVTASGHSWCNICVTDPCTGYVYMNTGQSYNLALSLAFPLFWYKTEEELTATAGRTCDALQTVANTIATTYTPTVAKMPLPVLLVEGHKDRCDVLNEKWTPLYKLVASAAVGKWEPLKLKDEVAGLYKEIASEYKSLQELREKFENPKKKSSSFGCYGNYDF